MSYTPNLGGPIGWAVLTFIWYKRTEKQVKKRDNKLNLSFLKNCSYNYSFQKKDIFSTKASQSGMLFTVPKDS